MSNNDGFKAWVERIVAGVIITVLGGLLLRAYDYNNELRARVRQLEVGQARIDERIERSLSTLDRIERTLER